MTKIGMFILVIILLIICYSLTSCSLFFLIERPPKLCWEGETMGTFWRVNISGINPENVKQIRKKIQNQLDADDRLLSTWKNNSLLMNFNLSHSTSPWRVNEGLANIITVSLRVGHKTNGAMDVTIGSLVNLWGFGSKKKYITTEPKQEEINNAHAKTGLQHFTVINQYGLQYLQKDIPDLLLDLSTVGEGYAADNLAALMDREGITNYLVSVGGALVSRGMNTSVNRPWKVAIQKPTDEQNEVQAIVNINGYGISTSGSYRNYYELNGKLFSHIIDPRTGRPIKHNLVSVTVIAKTALEADAWDTGLMVLGMEKAKKIACEQGLAVYMIAKENNSFKTWMSPQFHSYLVLQKK